MTPDLKRLCEAAVKAGDGEGLALDTYDGLPEAIVRAVLMALREPSPQALEAGRWPAEDEGPAACLAAVIDHILDTKARRAKALQDLADIDRDLL